MSRNILNISILIALFFAINGCSSRGYKTANHNGKYYYFPDKCSRFSYANSNPDTLYCLNSGERTGVTINPASNAQVQNHLYQKRSEQQEWNALNRNIQMRNQNFQLQQINNNLTRKRYDWEVVR